jgi:thiol-disulfide isomerase/thioredoxin
MKKIILAVILTLAILMLLAGCAGSPSGQDAVLDDALAFNAETLSGDMVTEAVFADYDLTMINIWATYCSPCIAEMPELQELSTQLPKNVNLITICWDGAEDLALTQEIYDYAEGTFMVLFPDEGLVKGLSKSVSAVPTTIFVDQDGNLVGDSQIGVPATTGEETIVDAYLQLIADHLLLLKIE